MTTTTTFEDEVRAMLARRAADVPDQVDAPLPSGVRIAVVPDRAPVPRWRWLAVAATVALVLGGAGLVVRAADERDATERTGTTEAPGGTEAAPAPEPPAHLSRLPGGVDPTVGPVRGVGPVAPTPEEAMAAVLAPPFGEERTAPMPFLSDDGRPDLWSSWYGATIDLDRAVWTVDEASMAGVGGSVTVRRTTGGWQAVAVTSEALDLTAVGHTGDALTGQVRVDAPAPLRVTVETLAGDVLATSDLTVRADATAAPESALTLDDMGADPGGEPVVLRVEAGDRAGQVGLDGVRVAAYAAVVLTPGADPAAVAPPTTPPVEPVEPLATGEGLPPGAGALWRAPVSAWGEAPGPAAEAFAREAMGTDEARAVDPPPTVADGVAVDVVLELAASGVRTPVHLAREGDAWRVLQVDEGRVEPDRDGAGLGYGFGGPASEATGSDVLTVVRTDGTWERYSAGDLTGGLRDEAAGWILTVVDDEGRVLAATARPA